MFFLGVVGRWKNSEEILLQILVQNKLLEGDLFFLFFCLFCPAKSCPKTKHLLIQNENYHFQFLHSLHYRTPYWG